MQKLKIRSTCGFLVLFVVYASAFAQDAVFTDQSLPPLKRVVFYNSGVAHMQHRGSVEGQARLEIRFSAHDVDDVLKSLVFEDQSGGHVRAVEAAVLTPNAPEAAALTGIEVSDEASQRAAGEALRGMGARAVLVKGGHIEGPQIVDLLVTSDGLLRFESPRIETAHTHGTGCTLASAIAAGLAQEMDLPAAVARARNYVMAAIAAAPGFGAGHGPIDHTVTVDPGRIGS